MTAKLRPYLFAGAAILFVAAVAVGGFVGWGIWSDRQAEQARGDSTTAARRTVQAMFSYDFHTVDTELPRAADNLTPEFRKDYLKLVNDVIAKGAKEKELTVKANTQASGVVSADRSHAVVLLYLNQITTSKDAPQGTVTPSRVRVTLDKEDGHWLVAQVTPV
ncbi:tetratricopeptide repeat protein [Nocardia pseudobrasiliensis]|uniref:Mce-associated membrane protein n=1 Tax=Nocardia pseudobrasiliensis TaxID=45979 RepID=A0A370I666_9NOCA|nr:tetratricopeptide repeat protein [Nocardia pseudobrasiliensis]RDI66212.1 Mce-associated membrane protein [Nocardia pseudobrasiliensis]